MRFDVFVNENVSTRKRVPYVLVVQSDLLSGLETQVVVPLGRPPDLGNHLIDRLMPKLQVDGREVVMLTSNLAPVPASILKRRVTNLEAERRKIVRALDVLFEGI